VIGTLPIGTLRVNLRPTILLAKDTLANNIPTA
jgi:hypothetical protein